MKRALVVGSAGQDGRILADQLRAAGTAVVGVDQNGITYDEGVAAVGHSSIGRALDVRDVTAVRAFVEALGPAEVYYLAAHHHSSEEATDTDVAELFRISVDINLAGLVHLLDAMKRHAPSGRLFYAASSHVFGKPEEPVQNERTPRRPINVYGITKSAGMDAVRFYRDRGIHASSGILYNHESIYRSEKFVSMRLATAAQRAAAAKKLGETLRIEVGSLSAVVDWGYAPDYTMAMQRIVAHPTPDEYVIASGQPHTVAELADAAFEALGLDYREHVSERSGIVQKPGVTLVGDATKLRAATGWKPTITFTEMVSRLARGVL